MKEKGFRKLVWKPRYISRASNYTSKAIVIGKTQL